MDFDYFGISKTQKPGRGDLLISEPYLPDPNFERSVIYLCEHDENGSFGFVLNKKSILNIDEVMEAIEDFKVPLFVGGPVEQETLHFLHCDPDMMQSGKEISEGIYWGGNFEKLLSLIVNKIIDPNKYRFFLGYSGWTGGQLEDELKAKSWIVHKNTAVHHIFEEDPDLLWRRILQEMGGKFKMFSNYPTDPRLN